VNKDFVYECHKKRIRVIPWVANEAKLMERLLNDGVDGIISDYPDRLFRVYSKWSRNEMG
jgi:glycerophosphoryl diester phosphodiesterase